MLQAYGWKLHVKINNNDWEDTGCSGWSLIEGTPPREETILTEASFEEICDYIYRIPIKDNAVKRNDLSVIGIFSFV